MSRAKPLGRRSQADAAVLPGYPMQGLMQRLPAAGCRPLDAGRGTLPGVFGLIFFGGPAPFCDLVPVQKRDDRIGGGVMSDYNDEKSEG